MMLPAENTPPVNDLIRPARRAARFYALTVVLSWALAAVVWAAGFRWIGLVPIVVGPVYMWIPGIVAVVLARRQHGSNWRDALALRWRWSWLLGAALLGPVVLAVAATGVGLLLPGTSFDPTMEALFQRLHDMLTPQQIAAARAQVTSLPIHPFWLSIPQALLAGATVNSIAALGEELGWRGYLHQALGTMSFTRRHATIGALWGIWHVPLILQGHNYPRHPLQGVILMIVFCVLLAVPMGYLREASRTLVAPTFFHGTLNACAGMPLLVTAGGDDTLIGMTGLAGLLVLLATWPVALVLRHRSPMPAGAPGAVVGGARPDAASA
ncbi:MAG: CPBP family intramembrane metalloprotease [Candidatus Schekmanbacteria bacterium]|nr:CPBP family intramembrane metalloprotease [Candidatus Schekmanbacteria bacterium]